MLNRRKFMLFLPAAATAGSILFHGTELGAAPGKQQPSGVGAIETLMRGHGLLLRAAIAYDEIAARIAKGESVDPALVLKIASVFKEYLEGFHEPAEEKYIFAPMEKAKLDFDSIQELKIQHGTGFELTARITDLAKAGKANADMAKYLIDFGRMYRYHAAWEDTVVFPSFDELENRRQLTEIAEAMDAEEKKKLGDAGFKSFVDSLASVEKQLGIFGLTYWTPALS